MNDSARDTSSVRAPPPPPPPSIKPKNKSILIDSPSITELEIPVPRPPPPAITQSPPAPTSNNVMNVIPENRIKDIFDQLSSNYIQSMTEERKKHESQQMSQIQSMLKEWSESLSQKTKVLVEESLNAVASQNDLENIHSALNDAQSRRSKILEDIKEAHNLQLQILKQEIAEERRDAAQAQIVFEQTLRTKYDNLVVALQEKIKTEQEARMQRALEDLERSARLESERAKQSMELQQAAEVALSTKFKSIVGDLRKSWEDEELQRAKFLEERLRGHYSAVLEHMEAQLHMALQLQDDADKRWMEDVQERNRQQVDTMKAFEEKCTRLYDTRLKEYVSQSEDMISQYEAQLLQVGSTLAMERYQFESRQRRLRLACSKWKVDYQRQLHGKYRDLLGIMESRYGSEIESLLQQIADMRQAVQATNQSAREIEHESYHATGSSTLPGHISRNAASLRAELHASWEEAGTTAAERIEVLSALLDEAETTPGMLAKFNDISSKLSARLPILQALSKKQLLEYKIKLALRNANANSLPSDLTDEINELQAYITQAISQYESTYRESFNRLPESIDGNGLSIQTALKTGSLPLSSPMTGFPGSFFANKPLPGTIQPGSASNPNPATNSSITGSPPGTMNRSGSKTTTIQRKLVSK